MSTVNLGRLICCIGLCLGVANCAVHFRVSPPGLNPATAERRQKVHALFWGLLEQTVTPDDCQGNGLAQVTATTSLAQNLIAVGTLGVWTPMTIEWSCAKDSGASK
jgi:hypothetical protein